MVGALRSLGCFVEVGQMGPKGDFGGEVFSVSGGVDRMKS